MKFAVLNDWFLENISRLWSIVKQKIYHIICNYFSFLQPMIPKLTLYSVTTFWNHGFLLSLSEIHLHHCANDSVIAAFRSSICHFHWVYFVLFRQIQLQKVPISIVILRSVCCCVVLIVSSLWSKFLSFVRVFTVVLLPTLCGRTCYWQILCSNVSLLVLVFENNEMKTKFVSWGLHIL